MNYDKQKALSTEEINSINNMSNMFDIINICTYSQNNTHLYVSWDLPIEITRNEDEFYLDNNEPIKENYWVVYLKNGVAEYDLRFEAKQFKKIEDAINYAINNYKQWLTKRMKDLE